MVRNGDAHLKNFGVLYRASGDVWLAPMFDVVTTAIYRYARYPGGPELEDRTLARKLYAGRHESRVYPTPDALLEFGRRICGVAKPALVLQRIAHSLRDTLDQARQDARIPRSLLDAMRAKWEEGIAYAG